MWRGRTREKLVRAQEGLLWAERRKSNSFLLQHLVESASYLNFCAHGFYVEFKMYKFCTYGLGYVCRGKRFIDQMRKLRHRRMK